MTPVDRRRLLGLSAAFAVAAGAGRAQTTGRLPVIASFSILEDFVRQVGGERVDLGVLVGPDADAHVYQPSAADSRRLAGARLIVVNGLGFEGWMDRLIKVFGAKADLVVASAGVKPIPLDRSHDGHGHGAPKGAGRQPPPDPHAWQDVGNAILYVANIRDALATADVQGADLFRANADAYIARLRELDAEIRAAVNALPPSRRRIITSHDAFGYFGSAYGLDFIAPQGVSTEAEASAQDVARIIRQIRAEKAPAIFVENISDPRMIDRIARETGARVGGRLRSDALSAQGGPAGTYIDMMRSNIRELTSALAG